MKGKILNFAAILSLLLSYCITAMPLNVLADDRYTVWKINGENVIVSVDESIIGDIDIPIKYNWGWGGSQYDNDIKKIGDGAFSNCVGISSVNIPYPFYSIGNNAFSGCTNLSTITLNGDITNIGRDAFYNTAFYNDEENWENEMLFLQLYGYSYLIASKKTIVNANIKEGTLLISDHCFSDCTNLMSVEIPNSVMNIGIGAFSWCENLSQIKLPKRVKIIADRTFSACSSLSSITIPSGVWKIGEGAFYNCTHLSSVVIPSSVSSIHSSAFANCSNLTDVYYAGSESDWNSIVGAYHECLSNANIHYLSGVENGYYYEIKNGTAIITAVDKSVIIGDVIIPPTLGGYLVTGIGNTAFMGCSNLNSIEIPHSCINIGYLSFANCDNLTSIKLPSNISNISFYSFLGCTKLTNIYYGGSEFDWNKISLDSNNNELKNAKKHYYNTYNVISPHNNDDETIALPNEAVLDIGENLNFRNGYVNTGNSGYIKAGDKKITGSNIHFTESGKMKLDAGETAKIERDNGDGTTDQGFLAGVYNPTGIIRMTLSVNGVANGTDYTGRTISRDFDFTASEISGLANFGFEVKKVPKPLWLVVKSIE